MISVTFLHFSSIQFSRSVVSDSLRSHGLQHARFLSMGILQARILEWAAMPSSRGSSQSRDQTQVSHIAGGFFISWATREAWRRDYSSERSGFNPKGHLKTMIIYKVDSCKKTLKHCRLFCKSHVVSSSGLFFNFPTHCSMKKLREI